MIQNGEDLEAAIKASVNTKQKKPSWFSTHTTLIGWVMILTGVVLGLYVGLYLMFIGGIMQVVVGFAATPMAASAIAWGVLKVVSAAGVGWLIALAFIFPGGAILNGDTHKTRRTRW